MDASVWAHSSIEDIEKEVQKHSDAIIDLKRQRNSKTYIGRLPPEIFSHVFLFIVLDGNSDFSYKVPRNFYGSRNWATFTWVCHSWREVAINDPSLWSYFGSVKSIWTETMIARSRAVPLHFRLSEPNSMLELLAIFCNRDMLERINEFHVMLPSTEMLSFFEHLKEDPVENLPPSSMTSIRLSSISHTRHDPKSVDLPSYFSRRKFPRLHHLDLSGCKVDMDSPMFASSSLTHLSIHQNFSASPLTTSALLSLLQHNPSLQQVDFELRNVAGTKLMAPRVLLSHLQQVRLAIPPPACLELMKCLIFDQTSTKVILEVVFTGNPQRDLESSILPLLTCRYMNSSLSTNTKVPTIHCLSLDAIRLEYQLRLWHTLGRSGDFSLSSISWVIKLKFEDAFVSANVGVLPILLSLPLANLRRLEIIRVSLTPQEWASALDGLDRLKELSVEGAGSVSVFAALRPCLDGDPNNGGVSPGSSNNSIHGNRRSKKSGQLWNIPLHKLQSLELNDIDFNEDRAEHLTDSLRTSLKIRMDAGVGLRLLSVTCCANFGTDDLNKIDEDRVVKDVVWDGMECFDGNPSDEEHRCGLWYVYDYEMDTMRLLMILVLLASTPTNANLTSVVETFHSAGIIPDVLSVFNPTVYLQLEYLASNISHESMFVDFPGSDLTINQTHPEPIFYITLGAEILVNQNLVMVAVDPDAPSRVNPSLSQYRNLLAPSVQLNGMRIGRPVVANMTQAISPYVAPSPHANSGWHRYVFLLYIQPSTFLDSVDINLDSKDNRSNWNVSLFAQQMGLGEPIGGTFFCVSGPNDTSIHNSSSSSISTSTSISPSRTLFSSVATTSAGIDTCLAINRSRSKFLSTGWLPLLVCVFGFLYTVS